MIFLLATILCLPPRIISEITEPAVEVKDGRIMIGLTDQRVNKIIVAYAFGDDVSFENEPANVDCLRMITPYAFEIPVERDNYGIKSWTYAITFIDEEPWQECTIKVWCLP